MVLVALFPLGDSVFWAPWYLDTRLSLPLGPGVYSGVMDILIVDS